MCYDSNIGAGLEIIEYCDRMRTRRFEVEEHEKDIDFSIISRRFSDFLSERTSGG